MRTHFNRGSQEPERNGGDCIKTNTELGEIKNEVLLRNFRKDF